MSTAPHSLTDRRLRRTGRLMALLALVVYLGTTGGSMATDIMSYEVTKGIVERGSVAMSYNVFQMEAHRGVDGRYYAPYGIGHAVYSTPFYAAARLVERAAGARLGKPEVLTKAGFVVGSAFAAALTVWATFWFAWRLSADIAAAVLTAIAVAFGSLLWPYAKFGFNAPLATFCVVAGTYGVWAGTRGKRDVLIALGGAGLGGALLVKHELALVCVPIGIWIIAESWPDRALTVRRAALSALPVLVALGITLFYNEVRFGNPLDTGYLRDDTLGTGSLPAGLSGLLFSPGRSVFLYSPIICGGVVALFTLARRDRTTAWLLAGEFLVMLFFYASLVNWDAERSYGPRYLLPVVPLLILPIAVAVRRTPALLGLVVVSCMWQLPGVLVDFSKVGAARVIGQRTEHERQWTWDAAGLVINTRASARALPDNLHRVITGERPPVKSGEATTRDFSDQFAFSLDFWWVYLFYLRVFSAPIVGVCAAAWLIVVATIAHQLRALSNPGAEGAYR